MTANLPATQSSAPSLPDRIEFAKALADSGLLPAAFRKQPASILWAMEYGDTLGISTLDAIQSIHVIEGKPSASSDLIAALVRRAGHRLRVFAEYDDQGNWTASIAQVIRIDDQEFTYEARWTPRRAQNAGLMGKPVWKNYGAAMGKARAITEVAREACSEVLHGAIYTPEELGAPVDQGGHVIGGTLEPERPAPPLTPAKPARLIDKARAAKKPAPVAASAEEPVEAEIIPDPGPESAAPAEGLRSEAQSKALFAMLGEHGVKDRDDVFQVIALVVDRPIESTKELTKAEASKLLDELPTRLAKPAGPADDDPPPWETTSGAEQPAGWNA